MNQPIPKPYWLHWPADLFEEMQERLERLYEGGQHAVHQIICQPPADVRETADRFLIDVELPGVDSAGCNVHVLGRTVMIAATRDLPPLAEGERSLRSERRAGAFARELTLPADVDATATRATYQAGVLQIELPKQSVLRSHKVSVQSDR